MLSVLASAEHTSILAARFSLDPFGPPRSGHRPPRDARTRNCAVPAAPHAAAAGRDCGGRERRGGRQPPRAHVERAAYAAGARPRTESSTRVNSRSYFALLCRDTPLCPVQRFGSMTASAPLQGPRTCYVIYGRFVPPPPLWASSPPSPPVFGLRAGIQCQSLTFPNTPPPPPAVLCEPPSNAKPALTAFELQAGRG